MARNQRNRRMSRFGSTHWVSAGLIPLVFFISSMTGVANADQHAEELPALFEELAQSKDFHRANQIEQMVWGHWLTGPDPTSDHLMVEIQNALQLGRPQVGLVLCNQLIDKYPDYAEGWNKRATFYFILNRFNESVEDIQTTLSLEPNHFGALSGLGLILLRTGDAEGALAAFEAVLEINPQSISAQQNVARAKDRLGTEI